MLQVLWSAVQSTLGSGVLVPVQQRAQLQRQLSEIKTAHEYRVIEQAVANRLHMEAEAFHQELAAKADAIRAHRGVETAEEIDLNRRFADNNPFYDPLGYAQKMLFTTYAEEQRPILLISPFWDETVDAGGLNHLRTAMSRAWENAPW